MKKEVKDTPFSSWSVYRQFSKQLSLLYKEEYGGLTYKIQYILTFPFKIPSWLPAHEKYLLVYSSPDCLEKTSQKIRYFRHKNCMYAKDVAKYLGMDRTNYGHYEEVAYEYCPLSTTIYLWVISLTASKELSILLLKLYNDGAIGISAFFLGLRVRKID